jgi:hypothetical protein
MPWRKATETTCLELVAELLAITEAFSWMRFETADCVTHSFCAALLGFYRLHSL